MRILTSALLAALILTLPLSVIAAPSLQSNIDIKTLALTRGDITALWPGFDIVPDRTVSEDRQDGVAVYDVTFARERTTENLGSGPVEVRSGVARTSQVQDAVLQLESTKEAFLTEGWTTTGVPPLGDETLGLTQTTDGDTGKIAHYSYLFRKGPYILMIGIRGRPDAVKITDAVGLAITVSGRLDKALAGGAPAAPGSSTAPSSGTGSEQRSTGERVKVVNADGGNVNVRAEPSTGSDVVTQVSEGTMLDIVGANKDGDERTWRNVKTTDNKTGWIASTFLETVSAPAPAPGPSPAPSPSPSSSLAPTGPAGASEAAPPAEEGSDQSTEGSEEVSPTPSPTATAAPSASSSGATFKGSGNGLNVDGQIREPNLSGGKQQVKVHVTRSNGQSVGNAFVDITARLDASRYRAIKADRTNNDGWTEVEWDMEGPPGTYEIIVDVKTDENGPVTTAKGSFKWKS
jgi:hypothetical protein